jgi:hypothetical protein
MQILTIADLLAGKRFEYPPSRYVNVTFKKAPKAKADAPKTPELPL